MQPRGGFRIKCAQDRLHRFDPFAVGQGLEHFPLSRGGIRRKLPAQHQRVHIKPRAAGEDAGLAPVQDVPGDGGGHVGEAPHGEGLGRIGHVDHMVGHAPGLVGRNLGGADVPAPIDLHGVAGYDLAVQGLCQRHRQPGLPRGRGPDDADHAVHSLLLPDSELRIQNAKCRIQFSILNSEF